MERAHGIGSLAIGLLLSACVPEAPEGMLRDAERALNSGDSKAALASFDAVARTLPPGDPRIFEARLGAAVALIALAPANEEAKPFLDLAREMPERATAKEYLYFSGQLVSARKHMAAIDVVEAAKLRFGDLPALAERIDVIKRESIGVSEVQNRLGSLGYL